MKLRIKGNAIRLRLSQSEVDELVDSHVIYEMVNFGKNNLVYQLNLTDDMTMSVIYADDCISINVPKVISFKWAKSDQVGFEEMIAIDERNSLSILIEKDFKCLTDRPNEDESDLFANPLDKHND
jgi:hypothetical protein